MAQVTQLVRLEQLVQLVDLSKLMTETGILEYLNVAAQVVCRKDLK